ncbi:MAG: pantetheine-phosphate adenylyltransferase [Candidatus Omnitrophica bacterium]|nr:pantetheine-phosphate adenylyltransferase [Candidatus Omnitrophota bacterium]MCM8777277.1 pantetheine-phosphate adenylyltransferase [Candidatus Omnitrophota bacterium]
MKEKIAVYPGSFDPVTNGHIDVVKRALVFVDKVIVAVADYSRKNLLFTKEERIDLIKTVYQGNKRVEVDSFNGLLVDYLKKKGINLIVRGLRAVSDFEYEFQMALANRKLSRDIETVFLMPGEEFFFISSSIVKEIASLKGNVSEMVPEIVAKALKKKFNY